MHVHYWDDLNSANPTDGALEISPCMQLIRFKLKTTERRTPRSNSLLGVSFVGWRIQTANMLLKNTNCQILDQYSADKKTPESIFSIEKKSLPQREMNARQRCARHDGTSGSRKLRLFLDFCRLSESPLKFFNKKNEICNIFTLWKCIYVGWRHILSYSIKADFSSWWWTWSGPQVSTLVNYVIWRMWSCFIRHKKLEYFTRSN